MKSNILLAWVQIIIIAGIALESSSDSVNATLITTAAVLLYIFGFKIGRSSAQGLHTYPEKILKEGAVIKIAYQNFYSPESQHFIIPVFILDFKKRYDKTKPVYILFTHDQIKGKGDAYSMREGYNFVWNGTKLVSATE